MRTLLLAAMTLALLAASCGDGDDDAQPTATPAAGASQLSLASSAFDDNGPIPARYTCDGDNVSPPLAIAGVPEGAAALVLTVVDIDVSGGFVHWTVINIDPSTTAVAEGAVPVNGTEGQTSAGDGGYFGPCPPSGEHRYVFSLSALDASLDLDASATRDDIEAAIEGHVLDQTQLTGAYAR